MKTFFYKAAFWAATFFCIAAPLAAAVELQFDYSYDESTKFFAAGSAARATLEAAGDFYSSILLDSLSAVDPPDGYYFTGKIYRPDNTNSVANLNVIVPQDKIIVYVGSDEFPEHVLGCAGPGWCFTNYATGIHRGEGTVDDVLGPFATDFAPWGGWISIASDENWSDRQWNLDHTVAPAYNEADLYSVILHELSHVLGIGTADSWYNLIDDGQFGGADAMEENDGSAVPVSISTDDGEHWEIDSQSTVYGSFAEQEAAMTPYINYGTRKVLTALDVAGLDDIGWDIEQPLSAYGDANLDNSVDGFDVTTMAINWLRTDATWTQGDFNGDGVVNDEDAALLSKNWLTSADVPADAVPEPGLSVLLLSTLAAAGVLRRKLAVRRMCNPGGG